MTLATEGWVTSALHAAMHFVYRAREHVQKFTTFIPSEIDVQPGPFCREKFDL